MNTLFKTLIVTFLFLPGLTHAEMPQGGAKPYHRFWRGVQRSELTQPEFESKLNIDFFPLYPLQVPYGLISYCPVLPMRSSSLAQEWALVTYQSEEIYLKFKDSDFGKQMGLAHWNIFDRNQSASVVPEAYQQKFELNHAYELRPEFQQYSSSTVVFQILPASPKGDLDFASGAPLAGVQNKIILLTPQDTIIYWFFDPRLSVSQITAKISQTPAKQTIFLKTAVPGKWRLTEGSGMNSLLR